MASIIYKILVCSIYHFKKYFLKEEEKISGNKKYSISSSLRDKWLNYVEVECVVCNAYVKIYLEFSMDDKTQLCLVTCYLAT